MPSSRRNKRRSNRRKIRDVRKRSTPEHRRRRRYERLFEKLGVKDKFEAIPSDAREKIYSHELCRISILVSTAIEDVPLVSNFRAIIDDFLDKEKLGHKVDGQLLTNRECIELLQPLIGLYYPGCEGPRSLTKGLCEAIDPVLDTLFEIADGDSGIGVVDCKLADFLSFAAGWGNECDRSMLTVTLKKNIDRKGIHYSISIDLINAQEDNVEVDGIARPIYRLGYPMSLGGFQWIEVPGAKFGRPDLVTMPVFIQQHALAHLHERLETESRRATANGFLIDAAAACHVVKEDDGRYWIELTDNKDRRLGYLLASVVEQRVLVRTFIFLTMRGTPEAELLHKELRLGSYDIKRLHLDEIATYVSGEIAVDDELVDIFERAGIGHLFELSQWPTDGRVPIQAETLKTFFRLDGREADPLLPVFRGDL